MDRIEKALAKLNEKERKRLKSVLVRILAGRLGGLDVKKLKGRDDIFRVRKGDLRVMYRMDKRKGISILAVERRSEQTYRQ